MRVTTCDNGVLIELDSLEANNLHRELWDVVRLWNHEFGEVEIDLPELQDLYDELSKISIPSVYFWAGFHDARKGDPPAMTGSADYMRGYRHWQEEDSLEKSNEQ